MRKALLKILVLCIAVCSLFFVFTACGGSPITFKLNFVVDGEVVKTIDTAGNEKIALPENPKKDGYDFDGWFWDKDVWEKPFTANSLLDAPLSSDMSVYAKWIFNGETTPPYSEPTPEPPTVETTEYFTKQVDNSYYGKVYNTTTYFDFTDKIDYDGEYSVCTDAACTKPLTDNKTSLKVGDNIFYILYDNGQKTTVTVRRRLIYTVTFNSAGGTAVSSQNIEEDKHAAAPKNPMRVGYTFNAWDRDFNEPIIDNTTITALWNANTNTPYKIEYYLQNLEDNNYTLQESDTEYLTGTTDTTVAATKIYEHFTVIENTVSANISPDGSTVLQVRYTRDRYTYTAQNENTKGGSITCTKNGTYKYNTEISLSATLNAGYDFLGWYNDETKISDNLQYSFNIYESTTITAKYFAHTDTPYKIEYYLQNLEDNNYTLQVGDTEYLTGTTDTTATATKSYEHFTIVSGTASKKINGDGSTVLKVYYDLKTFIVDISSDSPNVSLSESYFGLFKYGYTIKNIEITFNNYLGYCDTYSINKINYSENQVISGFQVFNDVSYVISCPVKKEMAKFNFNSTAKTCTITGITDKMATEIIVPDYVTSINAGVFAGCSKLISLTIPFVGGNKNYKTNPDDHLFGYIFGKNSYTGGTQIEQYYYNNTTLINSIYYIPTTLKSVKITGETVNTGLERCTTITNIIIGSMVQNILCNFETCSSLTSITVDNDNAYYSSQSGILYNKDKTAIQCVPKDISGNISLPDTLTDIKTGAFFQCKSLQSVIIPNSVISIYSSAFWDCSSLLSITIGSGVKDIGDYAFCYCTSLKSIIIPNGVEKIGNYAFCGCSAFNSITIWSSVTSIGRGAFLDCNCLTKVTFADTTTWHVTGDYTNWANHTGGTLIDVTNSSTNATNFRDNGTLYWYKI